MPDSGARKFLVLLYAMLAALFLILGAALAIEASAGGYGIGLMIVSVMAGGFGAWLFILMAMLFAGTAIYLRR